jgi:nitroreductase
MTQHIKHAQTEQAILPIIAERWSPRAFEPRSVALADLHTILEAGRWAASAMNEQPWRYVVARRDDTVEFAMILSCLNPSNAVWAKNASVLMISIIKTMFSKYESKNISAMHDLGLASATMSLQAMSMGIHTHWMGGFDHDKTRELCGIPDEYATVACIAMGYVGDPALLSEQQQQSELAPRTRKALSETIFTTSWGNAYPLIIRE